jgi:pimeloyl-ACP methyl ester carboxylesterase
MTRKLPVAVLASVVMLAGAASAQPITTATSATTTYHTVQVDGLTMFYREAGPKHAPTVLLLHGFPSSSVMFDTLIPRLADRYHLVAPDYPGFGLSDAPSPSQYAYTFDHLASTIDHFVNQIGLTHYTLYVQDYGGPVGMRLAVVHPERVQALIVQNAVTSDAGLGPAWDARRTFWRDRAAYEEKVIGPFLSLEVTKQRHLGSSPNPYRYDPHAWIDEFAHLSQPGQRQIQSDLFYSYQTNVAAYPAWQEWLRQHRPPTLVTWGRYDPSFAVEGANIYREAVPGAEVHLLDAGHFALDERVDEISALIRDFLSRQKLN